MVNDEHDLDSQADTGATGWLPWSLRLCFAALACGTLAGSSPDFVLGNLPAAQVAPAETPQAKAPPANPVSVQRFSLPGPLAGVVARVDLRDPRVSVQLVLANGGGTAKRGAPADCIGRLEVPSAVARRNDFTVAINASFFTAAAKDFGGRQVPYFVGNCAGPVGWHFSNGKLRSRPRQANIQATLVVHATGRLSMHSRLEQLPPDTRCAVSGNALVVEAGQVVSRSSDGVRHPRSAVGISEDGGSLLLVAVDGRQEGHSRGASLAELGELLKGFGAHQAINLDGGGSTAMVLKDRATGVFTVVNRPSDLASDLPDVPVERPVVDVLGVMVREQGPLPVPKR